MNLWSLVEWYLQGCLEVFHLSNIWSVCVWIMFILSAGLLLVTCRDYLPPWWTPWLPSNLAFLWSTWKQGMWQTLKMYGDISVSRMPSCSRCRIWRELFLVRFAGTVFWLLCLPSTAMWGIIQFLEISCCMKLQC